MCGSTFSRRLFPKKRKTVLIFITILFVFIYPAVFAAETASITDEADLLLAAGDYAGALVEYQKAVTQAIEDKDYVRAKTGVGKCQAALKQTEEAKATFKSLLYDYPELDYDKEALNGYARLVDFSNCREIEPKDAAESLIQGKYLFSEMDYPAARATFKKFLEDYPTDKNTEYTQYQIGRTYFREKDYEKAAVEFQKVIEEYPLGKKSGSAEWVIGYCLHYQKKIPEAILQFRKFIQDYPDHPMITDAKERLAALIHYKGITTEKRSYWYEALAIYEELHDKNGFDDPEVAAFARMQQAALSFELALRAEDGYSYQKAIEICRSVMEDFPEAPAEILSTALLMEGEALFRNSQKPESCIVLEELLEKYGDYEECRKQISTARIKYGVALVDTERPAEGLDQFEYVIDNYTDEDNYANRNVVNDAKIWKAYLLSIRNHPNVTTEDKKNALDICEEIIREFPDTNWERSARRTIDRINGIQPSITPDNWGRDRGESK